MSLFISYSRRDAAFVRSLHEALTARGRSTWVDWEGIPPSADWMRQIEAAIDGADAVVCVLSPDFVASPVCGREVHPVQAAELRIDRRRIDLARDETRCSAASRSSSRNTKRSPGEAARRRSR